MLELKGFSSTSSRFCDPLNAAYCMSPSPPPALTRKRFHSQPAESNSHECITGHFTQLRLVRGLWAPAVHSLSICIFANSCLSLANHVRTAFKLSPHFR